ncbi:AraC family transcriptional regulator [Roseivirga sp. E12]|uniref:AraC family transcriptional regulator n=1 Tax=Roseivirga sp. E12 TaxID=2819237 RepID=UPI001ABBEB5B|nr:AraC family transcriptional regulator [Roseivirga sp. E12]MBO3698303.1 helix-turn-helix transcriptional regulator [Roseivirga sp. E12]
MIAYKGQHTIHRKGGQIYWRAEHGQIEGINNGYAHFTSKDLLGEDQKTRFSIRFGLKGTQLYHINDAQLRVNTDQFLVMNHETEYSVSSEYGEDTTMLAFCFNENFVKDFVSYHMRTQAGLLDGFGLYDLSDPLPEFPLHTLPITDKLRVAIEDAMGNKMNRFNDTDDYDLFSSMLESVFASANSSLNVFQDQEIVKRSTKVELYKRLSIARDYIQAHFSEDVNLNELSKVACLSPYHFHRAFKHTFGITPKKFVTGLRIEKAKWLLLNKSFSVQTICTEVGFKDVSSFTRLFTSYAGLTPSVFRNQSRRTVSSLA